MALSFSASFKKNAAALAVCMIIGAVLSLLLRFEIYYDLLHYHYYNGFAFVHDRLEIDVAPANIHTFFNPLADALNWFLIKHLNNFPNVYLAITGSVFGMLLFICMKIYLLFFQNKFAVAAALVLGTTGFATWFQIGTTTNEIPAAVLVLTALYFILKGEKELFAAFLLGAAAGLKLTAATYCLSSGIAFLLFNFRNPKQVALFALCGVGGFLAIDGFWAWRLFNLYQNPFFPFLNGLFHSPYFADINFSIQAFEAPQIDKSFISLLFLPLLLISVTKGAEPTLDHLNFSDFRWFLACILLIIWIFKTHKAPLSRQEKFLMVWLILSWLIWFKVFLVVRYLIPVETMLPVFFVKAAISLKPSAGSVLKQAVKIFLCLFCFFICIRTTWNSDYWSRRTEQTLLPPLPCAMNVPDGTLFLTASEGNSAFLAQIAEKRKIRIVNRFENLWKYIAETKWGEEIKSAARSAAPKAYWITGRHNIDTHTMKCIHDKENTHTVCFPEKIADTVCPSSRPR